MFDELSEKLEAAFARLRGRGVLTEADIKEGLREVRRVLLEADVNFALTREFLERVEKKVVGVTQLKTVSPAQQLVKVVKARAEEGRVAVRNGRRHVRQELEHLEKDGELSRDDLDRIEKELEKLTHEMIAEVDTMSGRKEKELLED